MDSGPDKKRFDHRRVIQPRFNEMTPLVPILQASLDWAQIPLYRPLNWSEVPVRLNSIAPETAVVRVAPRPIAPVPPPPENVTKGGSLAR